MENVLNLRSAGWKQETRGPVLLLYQLRLELWHFPEPRKNESIFTHVRPFSGLHSKGFCGKEIVQDLIIPVCTYILGTTQKLQE